MPPSTPTPQAEPAGSPVPARFIPIEGTSTELEIWQDPTSGALFGVDASVLDQVNDGIRSPYNPAIALRLHEDALATA